MAKYYVQARKSVTAITGIIPEGKEVTAKMFKGGEKSIDGLLKKEIIGTKKPDLRTKEELVKEREAKKADENTKAGAKKKAEDKAEADKKVLDDLKAQAEELKIDVPAKATAEEIQKLIDDKKAAGPAGGAQK